LKHRRTDLVEVLAWGRTVGAVAAVPDRDWYAFEYDLGWVDDGVELAPLHMPSRPGVYEFPDLDRRTFHGLPPLLADALPDRFGNALVDAWLADEGIAPEQVTPLDRLACMADRGMGALAFQPPLRPAAEATTALHLADLVTAARAAVRGDVATSATTQEALRQLIQVGTSAGGARPKAVIAFNPETGQVRSGQLSCPEGFQHWLVKLDGVGGDLSREVTFAEPGPQPNLLR
jgi:serine/threonine-protein kinase HipA